MGKSRSSADWNGNYFYDAFLSISRTSLAESCVQSMLTGCLHPDARKMQALFVHFPSFTTKDGIRKRPQQITLNVLNRYGLKYTIDATKGTVTIILCARVSVLSRVGLSSESYSPAFLSIKRTSMTESSVLSKLGRRLHPDSRTPQVLMVEFPLFDTSYGSRKRPQ
ncbi:hypothetical protein BDN72DRAFT_861072 [Pluteus cervinus]|uniref:Uncharacterized protein n=1 Tax=Pluteus cervinus TaxID=181527 RepID=A0ACD3AGM1_9AGAR|nr:hypothetical protein BDN72DRAFT_861072 [Pluteus cervinus]